MKQWRCEEAMRLGVGDNAVAKRLERGYYSRLRIERINKRVVRVWTNL